MQDRKKLEEDGTKESKNEAAKKAIQNEVEKFTGKFNKESKTATGSFFAKPPGTRAMDLLKKCHLVDDDAHHTEQQKTKLKQ